MATSKAVKRWHFTTQQVQDSDRVRLIDDLRIYAAKWVFQLELCPSTNNLHFQGKVLLSSESKCPWLDFPIPTVDHWSAEVTKNNKAGWDYVMKDSTRVAGPWSDVETVWTPRSFTLGTLRPWQEEAIIKLNSQNHRQVLVVIDETGSAGKTSFIKHLKREFNCLWVPATLKTPQDIVRCVANLMRPKDKNVHHTICIDVPRAMTVRNLMAWDEVFSALESIKDGVACEDRYHFQQMFFEWPRLVVMVNKRPPEDVLSRDRWVYLNPADFPTSPPGAAPTTSPGGLPLPTATSGSAASAMPSSPSLPSSPMPLLSSPESPGESVGHSDQSEAQLSQGESEYDMVGLINDNESAQASPLPSPSSSPLPPSGLPPLPAACPRGRTLIEVRDEGREANAERVALAATLVRDASAARLRAKGKEPRRGASDPTQTVEEAREAYCEALRVARARARGSSASGLQAAPRSFGGDQAGASSSTATASTAALAGALAPSRSARRAPLSPSSLNWPAATSTVTTTQWTTWADHLLDAPLAPRSPSPDFLVMAPLSLPPPPPPRSPPVVARASAASAAPLVSPGSDFRHLTQVSPASKAAAPTLSSRVSRAPPPMPSSWPTFSDEEEEERVYRELPPRKRQPPRAWTPSPTPSLEASPVPPPVRKPTPRATTPLPPRRHHHHRRPPAAQAVRTTSLLPDVVVLEPRAPAATLTTVTSTDVDALDDAGASSYPYYC